MNRAAIPALLTVGVVLAMFFVVRPAVSEQLEDDTTTTQKAPAARGDDFRMLKMKVKGFESRACACTTADCADKQLEQIAMFAKRIRHRALDSKRETEIRPELEKAVACARKHLASD